MQKLERVWYSTSSYDGPLGHGWHHSLDMALCADEKVVAIRLADGRAALFPVLKAGGMQVNTPNKDAFVAASKPVYEEFAKEVAGSKDVIDRAIALGK